MEASINRDDSVDPSFDLITVREWAPRWLASKQGLKPTTRQAYDYLYRIHVEPRWGSTPIAEMTYADAVAWVAEMGARMSPSWTRQALLVLKQILDLAVREGRIARNVVEPVKAPRPAKGVQRFLTHDQLWALGEECGRVADQYRVLVLLGGYTGLLWGELRALRVKRLDLTRGRLEVAENIPSNFTKAEKVSPKSHKRRTVPFPRCLTDDVARVTADKKPSDPVFTAPGGGLVDNSKFRRTCFDPAVRALGLDPFAPHHLRDTAASLAVSAGASVKAIQRMLGHASAAMTLDVYAGLFSDDLDAAVVRLDYAATAARKGRHGSAVIREIGS